MPIGGVRVKMKLPWRRGGGADLESVESPKFDLDSVLKRIGGLGKFQKQQLFLLWLVSLASGTTIGKCPTAKNTY